ncbi:MAG: hypothetical protein R6X13_06175 [bacterium]
MQAVRLEPAHSLLENFSVAELTKLARSAELADPPKARHALTKALTRRLALDEMVDLLPTVFGRTRGKDELRLDRLDRAHGQVTVQVYSSGRPALGQLLLEHDGRCLALGFVNIPLMLENRWTVIARDAGTVPLNRLFAAFSKPGKIHPSAEAPPPRTRPFILDDGSYQLRDARLRFELARTGPVSFAVNFLRHRPPALRPEYLLEPIA